MDITASTTSTAAASVPPPNAPRAEATDAPARPAADAAARPDPDAAPDAGAVPGRREALPPARPADGLDAATRLEMQDQPPSGPDAPDTGREGPPQGLSDATARAAEEGYAKAGPATVPEPAAPADIGLNLVA